MKSYGRDSDVMISANFFKKIFWVLFNLIYIHCHGCHIFLFNTRGF